MSILHVNQIAGKIKPLFEPFLDVKDIKVSDPERDIKILTRCLGAYAIYNHTACTAEQAAQSIVDGGDDNGIDAIYYSPTLKELVIVQSKWIKNGSGEPESADIVKFCMGIEDLINLNFDRFNDKVKKRQAEIITAISAFDTKYMILLSYTGDKGIAEHGQRRIDDLLDKLNDAGEGNIEELVRYKKLDQAKIYTTLSKGLLSDPLDIQIGLHQWGKYLEPYAGYFGYISGEEIANLWNGSGRKLFHKNIRNVLGKTEVNEELQSTIQIAPEKFWYFNNGITIISDSIEKSMIGGTNRDLGSFKLINASVVNGAQTISSIGEIADKFPNELKKIFVLTRCISLQDAPSEFGNEVTKANNRQNRIENRDFVSQDPEQTRIREELAHDAITYNITRSDHFNRTKNSFEVEEATASLACASGQVSLAVQAKRELGKFYENLSKGIYKSIFNAGTTGRYLYNTIQINRKIEKLISDRLSSMDKKTGKEYGILVHGNRMISMLVFKQLKVLNSEIIKIEDLNIETHFKEVVKKMTTAVTKNFSDNFLATLFKNKAKCEKLEELCR
jgi:hypothetical protein